MQTFMGQRASCSVVRTIRVSNEGRIQIPMEVLERHHLTEGSEFFVFEEGDAIVLRKETGVEGILKDRFSPFLRASEEALAEVWDNPEDDIWNEV